MAEAMGVGPAADVGVPLDISNERFAEVYFDVLHHPVERRVRHAIETARAYARWNRIDEALDALLTAETIGPDQVRYHRLSRAVVRQILSRPRPPRLAVELSERMGGRSGLPRW